MEFGILVSVKPLGKVSLKATFDRATAFGLLIEMDRSDELPKGILEGENDFVTVGGRTASVVVKVSQALP